MTYKDISKKRANWRAWYHKNHDKASSVINKKRKELKKRNLQWFDLMKSKLFCSVCGENDVACLDFHHKDPAQKEINVSCMRYSSYSIARIQREIDKCIILCANHHRKLHRDLKLSNSR